MCFLLFVIFYFLERGENVYSTLMYRYGVLEVGCRFAIASAYRPSVVRKIYLWTAHRYHRLDSYAHATLDLWTIARTTIVGNRWVLMHLLPYAMANELTYDAEALGCTMLLYSLSDVSYAPARQGHLNTTLKSSLGCLEQLRDLLRDLTYTERVAGVTIPSIQ